MGIAVMFLAIHLVFLTNFEYSYYVHLNIFYVRYVDYGKTINASDRLKIEI